MFETQFECIAITALIEPGAVCRLSAGTVEPPGFENVLSLEPDRAIVDYFGSRAQFRADRKGISCRVLDL
jgi:hypothetical protein